MRTLRSQLVLSHALPFLLVLPLITVALLVLVETQVLLTGLTQRATEQATLLAQAVRRQLEVLDDPEAAQAFVASLAVSLDGRVVLLSSDGQTLAALGANGDGDSRFLPPAGIDTALRGETSVLVSYGLDGQGVEVLAPITDASGRVVGMVGVIKTLTGINSLVGRLRTVLIAALLLEIGLGVAVGWLLARRLARPIDATARAVVDLAAGQPKEPVVEEGPLEIRQLANAANVLAERLRLLEESRRRSLANVVHEIGRPLGAVRSAVHVLRGPAGEDAAIREELLGGVEAQIEGIEPLLDDLAQLHGQVSGQIKLDCQPVALSEWLPAVLLPWRAAALDKGLDWQAEAPGRLPVLSIDPHRLAQVVGNLLSNAIRYTPPGGRVAVTAGVDGQEVWLRVADNGPGIDIKEQQRVFEPFYRSERHQRFPRGLGLGLTIARDLVLAHDGRLELVSAPGQGSQFTIYLPVMA